MATLIDPLEAELAEECPEEVLRDLGRTQTHRPESTQMRDQEDGVLSDFDIEAYLPELEENEMEHGLGKSSYSPIPWRETKDAGSASREMLNDEGVDIHAV
mmetsp:Transcript_71263/g.206357  ORF Transcript_71263/g.206357 Transcript_71263/m.206357 type:complete len:101 (+) Transcript_71263:135-437(+)